MKCLAVSKPSPVSPLGMRTVWDLKDPGGGRMSVLNGRANRGSKGTMSGIEVLSVYELDTVRKG